MCCLEIRLILDVSGTPIDWLVLEAEAPKIAADLFKENFLRCITTAKGFELILTMSIANVYSDYQQLSDLCEQFDEFIPQGTGHFAPYFEFFALMMDVKELDDLRDFTIQDEEKYLFQEMFSGGSNSFILMDAVLVYDISPLIHPDNAQPTAYQTQDAQMVMKLLHEEGMQGRAFRENKAKLLGDMDGLILYVNVSAAELQNATIGGWYRVYASLGLDREKLNCGFYLTTDTRAHPLCCTYEAVGADEQDSLTELFSVGPTPEQPELNFFIDRDTEFHEVVVFDVGQALCTGIFARVKNERGVISSKLVAFFDFGLPHIAMVSKPGLAHDYAAIVAQLAALRNRDHVDVILSHWHMDHCILAKCVHGELGHTRWIAPRYGCGRAAQIIRRIIGVNGGTVAVHAGSFLPKALHGNTDITFGKIELHTPTRELAPHSHHHCLYMIVDLYSGNSVLLSGDSTYEAIPAHIRNDQYTHLQASHHGGNYGLPPVSMNPAFIPIGARGTVIYSAGPYSSHHHPSPVVTPQYTAAGWRRAHNTYISGRYTIP